jgi:hypothetical protein
MSDTDPENERMLAQWCDKHNEYLCGICAGIRPDADPDEDDLCYSLGHDDEVVYEDDDGYDWRCLRCGAEGWEDYA